MGHLKKKSGKHTHPHKTAKSQEEIPELRDFSTKNAEVNHSPKKIAKAIKEKLDQQEIEDTLVHMLEDSIRIVEEPVEETIDNSMDSFNTQVEIEIDFIAETADTFTDKVENDSTTLAEVLKENFEKTQELTMDSTKELVNFYVQNTNQALLFNQKWMESFNTQLESVFDLQKENLDKYKSLVSEPV